MSPAEAKLYWQNRTCPACTRPMGRERPVRIVQQGDAFLVRCKPCAKEMR